MPTSSTTSSPRLASSISGGAGGRPAPAGAPGARRSPEPGFRLLVAGALALVALLAWAYVVALAARDHAGMAQGLSGLVQMRPWTGVDFVLVFLMWAVMMVAMMVPSAAPTILVYDAVTRRTVPDAAPGPRVAAFATGYVLAWGGFSLIATTAQWALERTALLSSASSVPSATVGAGLLVAAGLYQWTPLKEACLRRCRAPLAFVAERWRPGAGGAMRMGLEHGAFCVGCCWLLMSLLFVGGVMNLLWVAAIAVFVLAEKVLPLGAASGRRVSGLGLVAAGIAVLAVT